MITPLQFSSDGVVRLGVMGRPHASETEGAVGVTALAGQLTVEAPLAGSEKSGATIV
jgi:hypothetical protein